MKSPAELIRLAERYASYLGEPGANAYLAWGRLGQIIRGLPPTQAFDLACHIIHSLPGSYLPAFGGGTIAHVIHHHGATLIDCIEHEAWRDVDFLEALSSAWIVRDDLPRDVLARLRVATGARIHIVSRAEHDARYRARFQSFRTTRAREHVPESSTESVAVSELPTAGDAKKPVVLDTTRLWLQSLAPLTRLQDALWTKPRLVSYMAQGILSVWFLWFLMTGIMAPLLLPMLLVALAITSMSPVTDVMLVAGAFALATAVAALAGLAIGVATQRCRQSPEGLAYFGAIGLSPYLTVIFLVARTEHGLIVAPAVLIGLASRPIVRRLFRRAR